MLKMAVNTSKNSDDYKKEIVKLMFTTNNSRIRSAYYF